MRDLLGGKGANLCEMARLGLPVPAGFVITTEACLEYVDRGRKLPDGLWDGIRKHLGEIEEAVGRRFGNAGNPLLVSVRSGSKFSMPGMMDTILNLGLNDETIAGLAAATDDQRFALDSYRRFIHLFSKVALHLDVETLDDMLTEAREAAGVASDAELSAEDLEKIVLQFKAFVLEQTSVSRSPAIPGSSCA